jgi:hypothetical protein
MGDTARSKYAAALTKFFRALTVDFKNEFAGDHIKPFVFTMMEVKRRPLLGRSDVFEGRECPTAIRVRNLARCNPCSDLGCVSVVITSRGTMTGASVGFDSSPAFGNNGVTAMTPSADTRPLRSIFMVGLYMWTLAGSK